MNISTAAPSSANPIPICTKRRGHRETMPAPSHAPSTAAAIIEKSVRMSTGMSDVKMKACATVGSVWPALSVPGMTRSGTSFRNLNAAVLVANDPMPSASKKFVPAPIPIMTGVGKRASVAGEGSRRARPRTADTARAQPAM